MPAEEMWTYALYILEIKHGRERYWKIGMEVNDEDTNRFWDAPLREWIPGGGTWFDSEDRAEAVVEQLYQQIGGVRESAPA